MSMEEDTALVRRELEVLNGHDPTLVEAFYAASYAADWRHHVPGPGTPPGPAGVAQAMLALLAAFPDCHFTVEDLLAVDDQVIVRWSFRATHRGAFLGASPTGKEVTTSAIAILRIANGKVAETWEEWDKAGLLQQLGVVTSPATVSA